MVFKKGGIPWNKGRSADPDSPNYDPRVAKYVNTHIGKPSGALGKPWKWSDESRERQSEQMKGRTAWNKGLTKETDLRVMKSAKTLSKTINNNPQLLKVRSDNGRMNRGQKAWNTGLTKETDPRVAKYANKLEGRPITPETRERIRKMRLAQSPEERTRIGRIGGVASMAKLTPEERSERSLNAFLSIPKTNTSIELILQEQLNNCGIQYTTQVPLLNITAVDIFIPPNICIFADGDYWHSFPKKREKDNKINKILIEHGYKVFRFWGSEIRKDPDKCVLKILESIKK